jgi:hypothetical protein
MATLQEYELDIKPAKIIKDQGLCKLAAESIDGSESKDELYRDQCSLEDEIYYIPVNID